MAGYKKRKLVPRVPHAGGARSRQDARRVQWQRENSEARKIVNGLGCSIDAARALLEGLDARHLSSG